VTTSLTPLDLNYTPLMNLPYPNGLDAPCDFDESWCAFTGAIDDVFTKFEQAINRTTPAVPFAMMQLTTQITIGNNNIIPFDTVVADTAGMTDLDSDLYGITIPKTGRYSMAFYFLQATGGVVNGQIVGTMGGVTSGFTISHQILDRGAGINYGCTTDWEAATLLQGDRITMSTFESGANSRTLIEAWMAVYWHADQEVP
jgi:hypothetical protein